MPVRKRPRSPTQLAAAPRTMSRPSRRSGPSPCSVTLPTRGGCDLFVRQQAPPALYSQGSVRHEKEACGRWRGICDRSARHRSPSPCSLDRCSLCPRNYTWPGTFTLKFAPACSLACGCGVDLAAHGLHGRGARPSYELLMLLQLI